MPISVGGTIPGGRVEVVDASDPADIKLRLVALECLNGVVEAVGLDFVLREVYKHATESKNPKAANEVLGWITTAIEDFGIQGTFELSFAQSTT